MKIPSKEDTMTANDTKDDRPMIKEYPQEKSDSLKIESEEDPMEEASHSNKNPVMVKFQIEDSMLLEIELGEGLVDFQAKVRVNGGGFKVSQL